jgi:hypothetical protein
MATREAARKRVLRWIAAAGRHELECGKGREVHKMGRKTGVGTLSRSRGFAGKMEAQMPDREKPISNKRASGSDKAVHPSKEGGSQQQKAQEWGGGSKASKGKVTSADKRNENSSAKGR